MLTEETMRAAGSRPVAERVIKRLGLRMTPDKLLADLTVERDKMNVVVLTYEGANRKEATHVVNAVGELTSGLASKRSTASRSVTAAVHEASVPEMRPDPKPLKNGLLALVWAWALFAGIPLALVAVLRR